MKAQTENKISQPSRFHVGQRVVVTPNWNEPYYTLRATVRETVRGEEVWKFYVDYKTRDYRGRAGGVFFAEEIKGK